MGRYRSFTVWPTKPSFTKRSIELWTVQLVNHFGDRKERRDQAAGWMDVSARTIDAWCSASDPRVISAESLMELALGATIHQGSILESDQIYDVISDDEVVASFRDAGHAAYIADLRSYKVVRRDGRQLQMTEEQHVRSRLRKIIASGHLTLRQVSDIPNLTEQKILSFENLRKLSRFFNVVIPYGEFIEQVAVDLPNHLRDLRRIDGTCFMEVDRKMGMRHPLIPNRVRKVRQVRGNEKRLALRIAFGCQRFQIGFQDYGVGN